MGKAVIGCYPYQNGADQYLSIVAQESEAVGFPVVDLVTALRHPRVYARLKAVNLNWFENINADSQFQIFLKFCRRAAMLVFFKLTGKKIVYTFHNAHPHNMAAFRWPDLLTGMLCHWSDRIVILCDASRTHLRRYLSPEALERKTVLIPPAHYRGCYPEKARNLREQWGIPEGDCVMGYIGTIQPYKNIELILDAARRFPDIHFVIAGRASRREYGDTLLEKARQCPNVIPVFRFLADEELPAFVQSFDFVLTPYDKRSSLNSGVVILAFTYGRTVICPAIGTLLQMGELSHVFAYDYETADAHPAALNEAIARAWHIFREEPQKVAQMGRWVENYVLTYHSRKRVRQGYQELYSSLLAPRSSRIFPRAANRLYTAAVQRLAEREFVSETGQSLRYMYIPCRKSETLAVIFQAWNDAAPRYNYVRTLRACGVHRLFIKDDFGPTHLGDYYLGQGGTYSVEAAVHALIQQYRTRLRPKKLLFIGSSKGGYAALNFGLDYPDSAMILAAPQYRLGSYLDCPKWRTTLEDIVGGPVRDGDRDRLDRRLEEKISADAFAPTQSVYIQYSRQEHTYENHIRSLLADLTRAGITVHEDVCAYTHHEELKYHFPPYLREAVRALSEHGKSR